MGAVNCGKAPQAGGVRDEAAREEGLILRARGDPGGLQGIVACSVWDCKMLPPAAGQGKGWKGHKKGHTETSKEAVTLEQSREGGGWS